QLGVFASDVCQTQGFTCTGLGLGAQLGFSMAAAGPLMLGHGDSGISGPGSAAAEDVPQVLANQAAGNAARDAIAARYAGSQTEVTFDTALGARRVDVLTQEGLAIESKVGYTSLTRGVQSQIAKDQLLM